MTRSRMIVDEDNENSTNNITRYLLKKKIIIRLDINTRMNHNNMTLNLLFYVCVRVFFPDEVCKKSIFSEKRHVCKMLDDCKTAIQDIRDNVKYPTICSFKGKMPVVCCAPETVSRDERLAKEVVNSPNMLPGITREYNYHNHQIILY